MRRLLTSIIGGGLAAAAVGGAIAVPALASPHAGPQAAAHTMTFTSVTKASIGFSGTSVGVQQSDVNKAGKVVGFDEVYGVVISASLADNDFTLDTKGGLLYGTYTLNVVTGKVSHGKVTGGTGAFKHATGTLTATPVSAHKDSIKITYRT